MGRDALSTLVLADEPRFRNKVGDPTLSGCMEWKGAMYIQGYGVFTKNSKKIKAHRAAFYFRNGRVPIGVVRHLCHNKRCVNPEHLAEGPQADNVMDTVRAGNQHHPSGELNGRAKLTKELASEIRGLDLSQYGSVTRAAKKYGVSRTVIKRINDGRLWNPCSIHSLP